MTRSCARCRLMVEAMVLLGLAVPAESALAQLPNLGQAANFTVLGFSNVTFSTENDTTVITGNLGVGPGGNATFQKGSVTGTVFVDPAAAYSITGPFVGTIDHTRSLGQAISDALQASIQLAILPPTMTLSGITAATTINGNGGLNVISVGSIDLNNATLTLSGGPGDSFVFNDPGGFSFRGTSLIQLQGGVQTANVYFNITGTGSQVVFANDTSHAYGLFFAHDRDLDLGHGAIDGAVFGGGSHLLDIHSGARITAVPEPGSLSLVMFAVLCLLRRASKRLHWDGHH